MEQATGMTSLCSVALALVSFAYRNTSVLLSLVVKPALRVRFPILWYVGREMEQATGIEPALKAWEALILPLNYACANFKEFHYEDKERYNDLFYTLQHFFNLLFTFVDKKRYLK